MMEDLIVTEDLITEYLADSEVTCLSLTPFRLFVSKIPHRKIVRLGQMLGLLMFYLDARHRRIVRRNLKFAFPEWEWSRVLRVTKNVYKNFGVTALEIFQISCSSRRDTLTKARVIQGIKNTEYLDNENGVFLITAHLGNWEVASLFVSGFIRNPFVAVARKIRPQWFEQWVIDFRTRFGGEIINKKGALPDMQKALRQGKILGVLIDQGTKAGEGVKVKFFGRDVQAHAAVALLALRCKSPVIPGFCVREDKGFRIILEPPINLQRTGDLKADIQANTQLMMDAIEKAIRLYPDQWFWFHKRWKVYYPHLYSEDLEKKRRKREREHKKVLAKKN
jgi:KDO2-lipid IV(A) lauroyltransferase